VKAWRKLCGEYLSRHLKSRAVSSWQSEDLLEIVLACSGCICYRNRAMMGCQEADTLRSYDVFAN